VCFEAALFARQRLEYFETTFPEKFAFSRSERVKKGQLISGKKRVQLMTFSKKTHNNFIEQPIRECRAVCSRFYTTKKFHELEIYL